MPTGADLHDEGSLTVDRDLMDAADQLAPEKVQVVDVISYAGYEPHELAGFAPTIVFVDAKNRRCPPASERAREEGRHEA